MALSWQPRFSFTDSVFDGGNTDNVRIPKSTLIRIYPHSRLQIETIGVEQELLEPHRRDAALVAVQHDVVFDHDDLLERIAHALQRPRLLRVLGLVRQGESGLNVIPYDPPFLESA